MKILQLIGDRDNRSKFYALKDGGFKIGYILHKNFPENAIIISPLKNEDATPVLLETNEKEPENFIEMTQTHFLKFFGGSIGGKFNKETRKFEIKL